MSDVLPSDGPGMTSSTSVINVRFDFLPPFELKIIYGNKHVLKASDLNPDKGQIPARANSSCEMQNPWHPSCKNR
jgi:hypothetical protein